MGIGRQRCRRLWTALRANGELGGESEGQSLLHAPRSLGTNRNSPPPPPPLLPTLLGARGRSGSEREKYQGCGLLGLWPLEETGLGRGWGGGRGQPLIFGLLQLFAHINSTIKISTGKKKKKERKKRVGSGHVFTHANFRELITLEIVHRVVGAAFFCKGVCVFY